MNKSIYPTTKYFSLKLYFLEQELHKLQQMMAELFSPSKKKVKSLDGFFKGLKIQEEEIEKARHSLFKNK